MLLQQFTVTLAIIISFILPIEDLSIDFSPKKIRVMAVGDIMMHHPITKSGFKKDENEYDFKPIFAQVKPIFNEADIVVANLETPLADQKIGFSGYPLFKAPKELALAIKESGIDLVTTANNHAFDQGEQGLKETLDILDSYGVMHTGTYRSQEEKDSPLIIDVKGVKLGIVSYTYGTNGLNVPNDKKYLVNRLEINQLKSDLSILKKKDVDYIIALVHFGIEYKRFPNEVQKQWVNEMYTQGIDLVIGSHPHVVQPFDKFVIYSLGNFLSNQTGNWKDYGIILDLTLEESRSNKKVELSTVEVIPTYVKRSWHNGTRNYEIIPLTEKNKESIAPEIWNNGQILIKHVIK